MPDNIRVADEVWLAGAGNRATDPILHFIQSLATAAV